MRCFQISVIMLRAARTCVHRLYMNVKFTQYLDKYLGMGKLGSPGGSVVRNPPAVQEMGV